MSICSSACFCCGVLWGETRVNTGRTCKLHTESPGTSSDIIIIIIITEHLVLLIATRHALRSHKGKLTQHTHTHTHAVRWSRWNESSAFIPSWCPPPGKARSSGQPSMRRPGTKSKCPVLPWSGTGLMSICSFLHVFVVVGFYGGNPGEHGENMQTPHRKAREQAPTCCTMRDLNPQPSCCEATVLRTEPPCHHRAIRQVPESGDGRWLTSNGQIQIRGHTQQR